MIFIIFRDNGLNSRTIYNLSIGHSAINCNPYIYFSDQYYRSVINVIVVLVIAQNDPIFTLSKILIQSALSQF